MASENIVRLSRFRLITNNHNALMPEGEKIGGASSKEWAESAVEIHTPISFRYKAAVIRDWLRSLQLS